MGTAVMTNAEKDLKGFAAMGAVMVRNVEYRIMQNRPGPGWYVEAREVVAPGVTDTHREAVSQTAQVARTARGEELQQSA
jgi:hypothetical protein